MPVLRVTRADGGPLAIVFGYACHNTTLQAAMTEFHGDYAGVAQRELERRYPGAQAMFLAGCGADVNPSPRGTLALVEQHGTALADAVTAALDRVRPLEGHGVGGLRTRGPAVCRRSRPRGVARPPAGPTTSTCGATRR